MRRNIHAVVTEYARLFWTPQTQTDHAEQRLCAALLVLAACGLLQLIFAFTIPYFTIGLLGMFVLGSAMALAREMWLQRARHLIYAVMQPPITCIVVYIDYVNLAEALDKDATQLATEDDLERTVQKNLADRVSAYAGVAIDYLVVLLSLTLAVTALRLRLTYLGEIDGDEPWVLKLAVPLREWWHGLKANQSHASRSIGRGRDDSSEA